MPVTGTPVSRQGAELAIALAQTPSAPRTLGFLLRPHGGLGIEEAAAPPSTFWRNSEETLKGFYWVRISDPMAGGLSLFASGNSSHGENGPDGNGSAKGLRCLPQKDKLIMETKMHRTCLVAVAALGFATVAFAADEHNGRPGGRPAGGAGKRKPQLGPESLRWGHHPARRHRS